MKASLLIYTSLCLVVISTNTLAQQGRSELTSRVALYTPVLKEAGALAGIDWRVLYTIAQIESNFNPSSVSPKGARGMMQFMPGTAARYSVLDPHDVRQAAHGAARHVRDLLRKYRGRLDLVLAAYNAGEGAVDAYLTGRPLALPSGKVINPRGLKTGGIPPYQETVAYVLRGLGVYTGRGNLGPILRITTDQDVPVPEPQSSLDETSETEAVDADDPALYSISVLALEDQPDVEAQPITPKHAQSVTLP